MKYVIKNNTSIIFCKDTILSLYFHDVYEHTKASKTIKFFFAADLWYVYAVMTGLLILALVSWVVEGGCRLFVNRIFSLKQYRFMICINLTN